MASASSSKAPCATCESKAVGIFKCEGCGQVFCRNHVAEHRDILSQQLDEIVLEYDILQQTIVEHRDETNRHYPVIEQINQWERDAIQRIQQTAEEARQHVIKLGGSQKETVSKDLHDLADQLRKARTDDDYVETDLRAWSTKLENLKRDINAAFPLITIIEDPKDVLIGKMQVSLVKQQLELTERFHEFVGDIHLEDEGRVAVHSDASSSNAYVRGITDYSKGKHKLRFTIHRNTTMFLMSFDIISKSVDIFGLWSNTNYHTYGWCTDDGANNPDKASSIPEYVRDLRDETTLELELLIDCDNRKIGYFNERTKITREMNIDIKKCPFPWKLQFFLYGGGDRVQLLSSSQIL